MKKSSKSSANKKSLDNLYKKSTAQAASKTLANSSRNSAKKSRDDFSVAPKRNMHETDNPSDKESSRRLLKFEKKLDKQRAKLTAKLKKLDEKQPPKHNIVVRTLFATGHFFRDKIWRKITGRANDFLSRRPHRSFYMTPRAKTKRSWKMRGYFGFIPEVWALIWQNKWLFTKFLLLYSLFSLIIVGLLSQENFAALRDALTDAEIVGFSKISALFSGAVTGDGGTTDSGQQILAALLFLFGWLTLVWLLRRRVNGDKVKLRDGLYNGGAPVLSTFAILLIILLQLLPFALVLLAYSSVTAVGWINTGIQIENMAAWCVMALTAVLTLYWICSSFIALIVVTLPGMYPFAALRAAGDLVVGRRLKLVFRLIFMALPVFLMWILILIPAILIDDWLQLTWQPLVPIVVLILTTMTLIWCAAYIYLLYRRMVDDPEPPVPSARQQKRMAKKEIKALKKQESKRSKKPAKLTTKISKIFQKKS